MMNNRPNYFAYTKAEAAQNQKGQPLICFNFIFSDLQNMRPSAFAMKKNFSAIKKYDYISMAEAFVTLPKLGWLMLTMSDAF